MKVIKANYAILSPDLDDPNCAAKIYKQIEAAGRTCYKSEDKITPESAEKMVHALIKSGHEAMIEHTFMTVRFTVDRGISHELVRHRIASFAQESTRYCNYSKDKFGDEITVIEPSFFNNVLEEDKVFMRNAMDGMYTSTAMMNASALDEDRSDRAWAYGIWYDACRYAEKQYFALLDHGCTPQEARSVLPNSLKTEVVMTANMREWRHFLKLRAEGDTGIPHPQMLEVAVPLLNELREKLPALFEDIYPMNL